MQNEIIRLARREIVEMQAYSSARSLYKKGSVWLDANENPWDDTGFNRYPDPQPKRLLSLFSDLYDVNKDQLLITRGSDEGIDLVIRLFCNAKVDQIMICPPTYGMYKVAATIQGAGIVEVPLIKEANFKLNRDEIVKKWNPAIKIIFLCSPNNPTGNVQDIQEIISLSNALNDKAVIVIDEAYIEFSNSPSLTKYLSQCPNLIVLRTLSKAHGLAGIRCGITIANANVISLLKKIIAPYPISEPIIDCITKNISNQKITNQINIIREEKNKLYPFLLSLSFVTNIWKSDANFILFKVINSETILDACNQNGIVLRDRSQDYNLENCIRSTVGKPCENALLMEVLSDVEKNYIS